MPPAAYQRLDANPTIHMQRRFLERISRKHNLRLRCSPVVSAPILKRNGACYVSIFSSLVRSQETTTPALWAAAVFCA
jgi:hypothetical protein